MAKSFLSRMNAVSDTMMANTSKVIREAAIAAASEAIMRTPVKTGNAMVNWKASFGSPKRKHTDPPATDSVDTNRQVASAEALTNAANAIKGWKIGRGNIYIANPVSYIFDLDRGSSMQARAGMTNFAIAAAKAVLREGRLLRG